MAATHRFKIYTREGDYVASVRDPELGAMLLSGASFEQGTIRDGHRRADIVYTEGADGDPGESYDAVARIVWDRVDRRHLPTAAAPAARAS